MKFQTIEDLDVSNRVVLVRIDINVPLSPEGGILDDSRMVAHVPTIDRLAEVNAKVVLLAHQGRPGKRDFVPLVHHATALSRVLGRPVGYVDDLFGSAAMDKIKHAKPGDLLLLENTRFYSEEVCLANRPIGEQANTHLVKRLSSCVDCFVNDAFSVAHRSQPSIVGFPQVLPSGAGDLMVREITALQKVTGAGGIAILGGVKVDDSIAVMGNLLEKGCDVLTGGLVAQLFLVSQGIDVGGVNTRTLQNELGEHYTKTLQDAGQLLTQYGGRIHLPQDLAVDDGGRVEIRISELPVDKPIMDVGSKTIDAYAAELTKAGSIIVNGPMGVFEREGFGQGTERILGAVASSKTFSVIGGGHTLGAAQRFGVEAEMGHVSTGGGALLTFLAGKPMPGIEALMGK